MIKKKTSKGQRGQVYLLVLGLLALGTIIVVPALQYTATAQLSRRTSVNAMNNLYTGDSAIEDALGELLARMGSFQPGIAQTFEFEGKTGTLNIPSVPPSQDLAFGSIKHVVIEAQPNRIESTTNGTYYIIRIQTQPWTATTGAYEFVLPAGFTYTPNSAYYWGPEAQNTMAYDAAVDTTLHKVWFYKSPAHWQLMNLGVGATYLEYINQGDPPPDGYLPNKSYLVVTTLGDGRQRLRFRPYYVTTGGNRTLITTVHVDGNAWGVHYLTAGNFQIGSDAITFDQAAALGVAIYTIKITIEGVEYQVVVAYDSASGTFKIVSYQMVG